VGDSMCDDAGLACPGAGQDKERARVVLNRGALLFVEAYGAAWWCAHGGRYPMGAEF
jgi:hypothetical protein